MGCGWDLRRLESSGMQLQVGCEMKLGAVVAVADGV